VAPVSSDDLQEVAALRKLLEGTAMEQSFRAGDMEWEGRIVCAHHKLAAMEARMMAGDRSGTEAWKRYDWEFHEALVSACGSRLLMQTHAAVYDKYLRYQMVGLVFRGEIAAREHNRLLQCALKRDSATAQKVLAAHIDGCVRYTLASGMFR
jgi:DNA-binding GntR family transcriptional regulator